MEITASCTDNVALLGAPDWTTRAAASNFLTAQGKAALDALVDGTTHANWRVRRGCADLMDHLADDRCTESLIRLLNDPSEAVRRLAIHALSCQGCKMCPLNVDIVAHLIERIEEDKNRRVRRVAVHQLGCQPPDGRARAALRNVIENGGDAGLISRARWALARQLSPDGGNNVVPIEQ